jgi:tetratricopeptide (TPR) repeat protein
VLEFLKRPDEALQTYDHLLALDPSVESNWIRTGDLLHQLGMEDKAADRYGKAISMNPESVAVERLSKLEENVDYLIAQAIQHSGFGKFEEALRFYDLALNMDSENTRTLLGKSVALRELKRLDESEEVLKKVLMLDFCLKDW